MMMTFGIWINWKNKYEKFDESGDNVGFVYSGFEVISRIDSRFSKNSAI